jgi:pimeloyl-ACP methyl ester carboxylesterase
MRKILLISLLLAMVVGAQYMAWQQRSAIKVSTETVAGNPVDHFRPQGESHGVVIVAHGFASNKTMMRPWGYRLAAAGFDTYVIDEPGHGASRQALPAWQTGGDEPLGVNLSAIIDELVSLKRAEPGRIALVGHSMGGAAVTQAALADERVVATVAISSAYGKAIPADRPRNLLSLAAERDPAYMVEAVTALAAQADGGKGELDKMYVNADQKSVRTSGVVPGRNHITILYDTGAMDRTAMWIAGPLGAEIRGAVTSGGYGWAWVVVALVAGMALVFTLAFQLSPPEVRRSARNLPRMSLLTALGMVAVAAFVAVLAAAWFRIPWPRIAVADYIMAYMLVLSLVLLALRLIWPRDYGFPVASEPETDLGGLVRALVLLGAFVGVVGTIIHMNAANFVPTGARLFMMIPLAIVLWFYGSQEEGLKRAVTNEFAPWAGVVVGVAAKLLVVVTWMSASALPNPQGFLPLIIPVVLPIFLLLEVVSYALNVWRYPPVGAAAFSSLVLAWSIAVTMPVLA